MMSIFRRLYLCFLYLVTELFFISFREGQALYK